LSSERGFGIWAVGAAAMVAGCSLAIGSFDECAEDADCVRRGAGLSCVDKLCVTKTTPGGACTTNDACWATDGYGTFCAASRCTAAPLSPRCVITEPPELAAELGSPITGRLLIGAIFKLKAPKELARVDSARLAIREMNGAGGVVGTPVGLVVCDNDLDESATNDADETEEATSYLAGTLGVRVIVGPSSSSNATTATNTLLKDRLATVVISPSATSSTLTNLLDRFDPSDPYGLLWRTCPNDTLQGQVLANTIDNDGDDRVAVIHQRDTYGQGLEEVFRADFLALDAAHVVSSHSFEIDESDLAKAVTDAAAAGPFDRLVVISGDATRTVHVLQAAAATATLGSIPLFLTDGSKDKAILLDPTNSAAVKAMVATARGTAPALGSGTAYQTFANNLKNEFQTDASAYSFLAHTYDAAYAGIFGLTFATRTGQAYDGFDVAAGLSQLSSGVAVNAGPTGFTTGVSELRGKAGKIDLQGTSGPLDFDSTTGEAPGAIEVWKVNAAANGFDTVTVVTP